MPAIVSDSFNGTAGTTINGRVTGAFTWSTAGVVNGLQVNGANQVKVATSSGALGRLDIGQADHFARALVYAAGTSTGCAVAVRAVDNLNFIGLRSSAANTLQIFKRVGSTTETTIATIPQTLTLPATLELRISGQTVTAFLNGAQVGATGGYTVADAVFAGVAKVGIWGRGSAIDPIADDFVGGTPDPVNVALVPAAVVHANRAASPAVVLAVPVAPASSRHAHRVQGTAVATGTLLSVARGLHAVRSGTPAIAVRIPLGPARALHPLRGAAAAVLPVATLKAAASRHLMRAGAPRLTAKNPGDGALTMAVPFERRTVPADG